MAARQSLWGPEYSSKLPTRSSLWYCQEPWKERVLVAVDLGLLVVQDRQLLLAQRFLSREGEWSSWVGRLGTSLIVHLAQDRNPGAREIRQQAQHFTCMWFT